MSGIFIDTPEQARWVFELNEQRRKKVDEGVFEEREHPRNRLGKWVHSIGRLHEITAEDVKAGRVPGMVFDPDVSPGVAAHMRDRENITFGPSGFRQDGRLDTLLTAHEIGHRVGQQIMVDTLRAQGGAATKGASSIPPELDAWRGEGQTLTRGVGYIQRFENPFGASERPEEILADAYSELLHNGLRGTFDASPGDRVHVQGHDEPGEVERVYGDWLHADVRFPDGSVEKVERAGLVPADEPTEEYAKKRLALLRLVAKTAREMGLPDHQIYRYRATGTEKIAEAYVERLHPRGRGGKWVRKLSAGEGMRARRAAHDVHDAFVRKELPDMHTGDGTVSALGQVLAARRAAVPVFEHEVLSELRAARPRYGEGKVKFSADSDPEAMESVQAAARWFPAEWVEGAGEVRAARSTGAGDAYIRPEIAREHVATMMVKPGEANEQWIVHEMAHWLEDQNPEVSKSAHEFFDRRTAGAPEIPLSELTNTAYRGATAKEGDFVDPYIGRTYPHGSTEVLAMAMEGLVGGAVRIEDDPDHLEWLMGLLAGDADEPVNVGDDVALAAKLLGEGKRVELNQPRQVSTLLEELAKIVAEANAKGEAAPNFDLCKVSVKGTNLFCEQTKGIPRVEMPQLKGNPVPGSRADRELPKSQKGRVALDEEFVKHLLAMGVKVDTTTQKASYLRASQHELNGANVARITQEMERGRPTLPIFVSRDDYIVDGHHQWAALVGKDARDGRLTEDMPIHRIDLSITDVLAEARRFAAEWGLPQQGFTKI